MYSPPFTDYLFVFSRIFLHDLFIFFLRLSILFINVVLKSFSWALAMLKYSGLAVIGCLGSHEHVLPWLLLTMFLNYCLGIWTWVDYSLGTDFWVCLLWVGVLSLCFFLPFWIFRDCDSYMLPVLLVYFGVVFTGNTCWCWRLGCSVEWRRYAGRLFHK